MNDKQILLEFQKRYHETLAENESLRQKLAVAEEALTRIDEEWLIPPTVLSIASDALVKIRGG